MINTKRTLKSFTYAWTGIKEAVRRENNIRVQLILAVVVFLAAATLHLNRYEDMALTFAVGMVLVLELTNTAIEKLVDHLHPHEHSEVAFVKDVLAGSVLVASIVALIIAALVFYPHL